jgi:hypothetical protein
MEVGGKMRANEDDQVDWLRGDTWRGWRIFPPDVMPDAQGDGVPYGMPRPGVLM